MSIVRIRNSDWLDPLGAESGRDVTETGKQIIAHTVSMQWEDMPTAVALGKKWPAVQKWHRSQRWLKFCKDLGDVQWIMPSMDIAVCTMVCRYDGGALDTGALGDCLELLNIGAGALAHDRIMAGIMGIHMPIHPDQDQLDINEMISDTIPHLPVYVYDTPGLAV
jgi:hypothetical protein